MNTHVLYRTSAILWVVWGLVHMLAGVLTMRGVLTGDISAAIAGIADAVNPEAVTLNYHGAVGGLIGQHGFNLFWIGLVTFVSAFFIWKGTTNAVFLAMITGGLADVGYFLFMDLGGYVNFVPGTVMTFVSALAIILSLLAYFKNKTN